MTFFKKILVSSFFFASTAFANSESFELFVTFHTKKNKHEQHFQALKRDALETKKEKNFISFQMFQDQNDKNRLYLFERWKDNATFENHLKQTYVTSILEANKTNLVTDMNLSKVKAAYSHTSKSAHKGKYGVFILFNASNEVKFKEEFESFYNKAHKIKDVSDIALEQGLDKDKTKSFVFFVLLNSENAMNQYKEVIKEIEDKFLKQVDKIIYTNVIVN
jgi:quinol monooxygenase YgiN